MPCGSKKQNITVKMSGGFELNNVTVKPKEQDTDIQDKSYDVEAHLCDPDNSLAPYSTNLKPTFQQGSLITILFVSNQTLHQVMMASL